MFLQDFDLCISCKEKDGHPHHMEKLGLGIDDDSSPADAKQANPQVKCLPDRLKCAGSNTMNEYNECLLFKQEARKLSIQRCIQSLVHACQCRDANCRLTSCQKMKRVVQHTKVCKRKTNGGCPICKQLIALCCYHAKHCQETKCLVPFCSNIKHKLKQQQLQQRLQQAQLLRYSDVNNDKVRRLRIMHILNQRKYFVHHRRRMAVMNTRPTGPVGAIQSGQQSSNVTMTTGVAMKPGVSPTNLPSPHQPGIGLKPGTQTPPAHVLQVVKQVQEEAARQQAPHVGYGKVTPGSGVGVGVGVGGQTGGVMPPPQIQRPMSVQMPNPGGTHLIPMDQWTAR